MQLESGPGVADSLMITREQYHFFMYSKETLQMT